MPKTDTSTQFEIPEIQLSYRSKIRPSKRPKVNDSKSAYDIFINGWNKSRIEFVEQFKVLLLNRANKALGICKISTGSGTGTVVDPKLVFAAAIKSNACSIILAHNHPSGNLRPSEADISLTKKMRDAGKLLEIPVLDHLIITTEGYFSLADDGTL